MKEPKILCFDIETTPIEALVWQVRDIDRVAAVKKHSEILCVSYEWLSGGPKGVQFIRRSGGNDKSVTKKIRDVLNQADIVLAQNGKKFDVRRVNNRIAKHEIPIYKPFAIIDTLLILRDVFGLPSNSLDEACDYFGIGRKVKHPGIEMWIGCMNNDPDSWKLMEKYNRRDVDLCSKLYKKKLRKWMKSHPNVALLMGGSKSDCNKCGSKNVVKRGLKANHLSIQQQYKCLDCEGWFVRPMKKAA